jgi:acyl carrier protein
MTIPAQISRHDIMNSVRDNLKQELGPKAGKVSEETMIADLHGASSAKQMRVIARTEKEFGISLGDEDAVAARTVGGFVDQVAEALGSRYSG